MIVFLKNQIFSLVALCLLVCTMDAQCHIEMFKTYDMADLFKAEEYQLGGSHNNKDHITLTEPFILDEDGLIRVSAFLKKEQNTLLRMNDLSYKLIKDADSQIKLSVQEMEELKYEGWIIRGFSGLEGRRNTHPDLSGMVFYHPDYSIIVVVYRGTAGNKDGWDTNFDATKMSAHKVQKEFCKDLFEDALHHIKQIDDPVHQKAIKKIIRTAQKEELGYKIANETKKKIKSALKSMEISPDLSSNIINAFHVKLELMESVEKLGANIEGEVHKGFLKKYLSTKREVLDIIKSHMSTMPAAKKAKLKIIFTGHSQAGATGNIALADICGNHGKEIFGPGFNNSKKFRFYGYFLSAARAGDKEYKKWVHEQVGQAFIVRQNVEGDLAPISSGDSQMAEFVNKIPVVGELLAKNLAQYDDTGYLLLDGGHKTWKRARDLYEKEGYDLDKFEETEDLVRYIASWVVNNEHAVPKFLAPKQDSTGFVMSPIKWTKKRLKTAKTINLIRKALMGDEDAVAELEQLSEVIMTRYAHLHYGHFRLGIGAAFDPEVVGRDLDTMAKRGAAEELKRQEG